MYSNYNDGLSHRDFVDAWSTKYQELQRRGYKLYFVTHTFVPREKYHDGIERASTTHTALRPNAIWKMYDQFNNGLLKKLLGSHFDRKRAIQPIAFACLDLPSTSYGRGVDVDTGRTPHVHAIYAVHPATLDRFKTITERSELLKLGRSRSRFFQTVHIKPIDPKTVWRVVGYSTKYLKWAPRSLKQYDTLWNVYPANRA